ncbi:hypothetical protein GCM10010260_50410 [Streptomyces filipinensis]|uniref:Uncharacterized protein n=1 Tax=Streptomyces filipinensis TaxID=66887 RepID=A0A918IEA0_9ACTN|nr:MULTISPECIES: hypothetical protein [Streptomyces]GGV06671.1 hypothetical protein GCM10010260_50410 [Streptomyces filipinensis]
MSITQQYLLDSHRARVLGEPEPPAPGRHDVGVLRELRDRRRFDAVIAGRPARGRVRYALRRWLRPRAL